MYRKWTRCPHEEGGFGYFEEERCGLRGEGRVGSGRE